MDERTGQQWYKAKGNRNVSKLGTSRAKPDPGSQPVTSRWHYMQGTLLGAGESAWAKQTETHDLLELTVYCKRQMINSPNKIYNILGGDKPCEGK